MFSSCKNLSVHSLSWSAKTHNAKAKQFFLKGGCKERAKHAVFSKAFLFLGKQPFQAVLKLLQCVAFQSRLIQFDFVAQDNCALATVKVPWNVKQQVRCLLLL